MRIHITGDTTHQDLEDLVNTGIARYGEDFRVSIKEDSQ